MRYGVQYTGTGSLLLLAAMVSGCGGDGSGAQNTGSGEAVTAAAVTRVDAGTAAVNAHIVLKSQVVGTTPAALGYNLGYFRDGSNAQDWWRYSGTKAARAFLSVSEIEPSDDISPRGDGVNSRATFQSRQAALRANAADPGKALDTKYVNWSKFTSAIPKMGGNFTVGYAFPQLRKMGVDMLANLTATQSRFPLSGPTDYANMWETKEGAVPPSLRFY